MLQSTILHNLGAENFSSFFQKQGLVLLYVSGYFKQKKIFFFGLIEKLLVPLQGLGPSLGLLMPSQGLALARRCIILTYNSLNLTNKSKIVFHTFRSSLESCIFDPSFVPYIQNSSKKSCFKILNRISGSV